MYWIYSHDYGNGLKLMEHSYIGNNFVGVVMKLLSKGGDWYKTPLVWCGDYFTEDGEENYYNKVTDDTKIKPKEWMKEKEQRKSILVNHTKKEYVFVSEEDYKGLSDVKKANKMLKVIEEEDNDMNIHPLPLLTALGNGRGGGDFHGENELIGYWARDTISVETEIPENYKELKVNFVEEN